MNEARLCVVLLGCILLPGLVFSESLLSFGLSLYRKWGWNRLSRPTVGSAVDVGRPTCRGMRFTPRQQRTLF